MDSPLFLWILFSTIITMASLAAIKDERLAQEWVAQFMKRHQEAYTNAVNGSWNYNTNLTTFNLNLRVSI